MFQWEEEKQEKYEDNKGKTWKYNSIEYESENWKKIVIDIMLWIVWVKYIIFCFFIGPWNSVTFLVFAEIYVAE